MSEAQYTVFFLIVVLFVLEMLRNRTLYGWFRQGLGNIGRTVSR